MEFQHNFHAYDTRILNRDVWEGIVLAEGSKVCDASIALAREKKGSSYTLPPLGWGDVSRNRSLGILADSYKYEQHLAEVGLFGGDYSSRKGGYYSGLAREIRNKKQFPLIGSLYKELIRVTPSLDTTVSDLMRYGIYTLYLMVCDPDNFLVGLKDGIRWKRSKIAADSEGENPAILNMATHYVPMLSRIGRRELVTVPESLIYPNDLMGRLVQMPRLGRSVDELLEDSYYYQRYLVPHVGADVRFRRARDLARMSVIKSGDEFIARVITTYGDEQVIINLEDASFITPDREFLGDGQQSPWATIVAETYHDLVTADEVSVTRYRRLKPNEVVGYQGLEEWNLEDPQVIYIPRRVRVTRYEDFRPKYDGPVRPIKPHEVTNYFRTANMTPEHRNEILELERQWNLPEGEIAYHVPAGKTWVRPHFSPKGSEVIMRVGPIFIKRRILAATGVNLRPSLPKSYDD